MVSPRQQILAGWGNCPVQPAIVHEPWTWQALRRAVTAASEPTLISRGLGRSYGDPALNRDGGVIVQAGLDRMLDFDEATGVLTCEAGVSLAAIIDHLLPRGWFLPTTPGTRHVTIGGAIASDVHGKNHHVDGSFGKFVEQIALLTADGAVRICSPDDDAALFWATVGGMGLTGVILWASVRLRRVETAYYHVTYRRAGHVHEALDIFAQTDADYRHSVAWIDCLAGGSQLGRSVVMLGREAPVEALPVKLARRPLVPPRRATRSVPVFMPSFVLNRLSGMTFNGLYYARHDDGTAIEDYRSFFYPLDGVDHWNRIYGRRGIVQYQALLPRESSRDGLVAMLRQVVRRGAGAYLAVLKSAGQANPGMLSYLFPGHTLAMDMPYAGMRTVKLMRELDAILLDHGGRLYLAKDSQTTAAAFARMYPRLDEFRQVKARVDPHHRFVSSQARRLGIVEGS